MMYYKFIQIQKEEKDSQVDAESTKQQANKKIEQKYYLEKEQFVA